MIRRLQTRDKLNFLDFCENVDPYQDFCTVKDNKKYFLTDRSVALKTFNDCLKRGDICYVWDENDTIKGIMIVMGSANKGSKKYFRALAKTTFILKEMVKYFSWVYDNEIYFEAHKNNPLVDCLKNPRNKNEFRRGYRCLGHKDSHILIVRSKHGNNYTNSTKFNRRPPTKRR